MLPRFLVGFSSDFSTSSIALKFCSFGFKTSTISSNQPTTESNLKMNPKKSSPFAQIFSELVKEHPIFQLPHRLLRTLSTRFLEF